MYEKEEMNVVEIGMRENRKVKCFIDFYVGGGLFVVVVVAAVARVSERER